MSNADVLSVPDVSVYDLLFADLSDEDRARDAAIEGHSGAHTTYGELQARIDAFAGALAARGIGVGDVVGLHAPNSAAFAIAFHGILRAGATATTVNALYTAEETQKQLTMARAVAHVTVSALAPASTAAAQAAGIPNERIVVLDGFEAFPTAADLLGAELPAPEVSFDPATHLAVIPFSSGTTGVPKGVMLTHRNLVANVMQCEERLALEVGERVMAVLPFFHIYGMTVLLNLALKARGTLVTMPKFDLSEFLRLIQDEKVSFAFIAPPIAVALAKHPIVDQFDLSSLRTALSGAAALDEQLGEAVAARLGIEMLQGYGMTEMSPVSHAFARYTGDRYSLSTIGQIVPGTEQRIVDIESLSDIAVPSSGRSESGELWIRGPQVMLGYLDNPSATAETLVEDGWLRTGDIAEYDADGNVYIVDRLKELIKYKGYQIAPAELEAQLLASASVADAAVVGKPVEGGDEHVVAFVVPAAGSEPDDALAEKIIAEVGAHTAPYKKIRRVEFVETIPKSSTGKILRKDLRATLV